MIKNFSLKLLLILPFAALLSGGAINAQDSAATLSFGSSNSSGTRAITIPGCSYDYGATLTSVGGNTFDGTSSVIYSTGVLTLNSGSLDTSGFSTISLGGSGLQITSVGDTTFIAGTYAPILFSTVTLNGGSFNIGSEYLNLGSTISWTINGFNQAPVLTVVNASQITDSTPSESPVSVIVLNEAGASNLPLGVTDPSRFTPSLSGGSTGSATPAIPEPSACAMLVGGLGSLAIFRRKR